MNTNIILNTDSYKASHFLQFPENTQYISSYIEPRWNKNGFEKILFFGLQIWLKNLKPITNHDIDEAETYFVPHGLPFNREGWEYILNKHGGVLPIMIEALPEGTVHNLNIPQVQVINTDPNVPWLTSYIETSLLRSVWYPSTVATNSWIIKQMIRQALEFSSDFVNENLPFKLHDFGARGASSEESAAIGGLAHLVNFMGTDTVSALTYARKFYHENIAGYSIPASEHSTITAWGVDGELDAYNNMLDKFAKPGSLVAVVSDSYDLWNAIDVHWGRNLHKKVIESGATVVIRPDSGDPVEVVRNCLEKLGQHYGYTLNTKKFKVLPSSVRIIQGDGVNIQSISKIINQVCYRHRWSMENIAFGMGGALLQNVTRDDFGYAMKANEGMFNGIWRSISKNPKTDPSKKSKANRQAVILNESNNLISIDKKDLGSQKNYLTSVWHDGKLLKDWKLSEIRENSLLTL